VIASSSITHVALLRAINVGGTKKVAMSALLGLLKDLGFEDGESLLQSGNLIFRAEAKRPADVEQQLETEAAKRLGLQTDFMVRTADEWAKVIARNPFPEEAKTDSSHLVVVFLKDAPSKAAGDALRKAITGPELIRFDGRQAYITYPDGIGRSRLTNTLIESKLGTRGTGRNWNTIVKIAASLPG
jgi:uncharacterized protein (DUF1697 family)